MLYNNIHIDTHKNVHNLMISIMITIHSYYLMRLSVKCKITCKTIAILWLLFVWIILLVQWFRLKFS